MKGLHLFRDNEPLHGRLASAFLLVVAAAGIAIALLTWSRRPEHLRASTAAIYFGIPALLSLGALVALRFSTAYRTAIATNLIALGVACYGFEIGAAIVQPAWYANMAVRSMPPGISSSLFDRRTPLAVTSDLRRSEGDSIFALPSRPVIMQAVEATGGGPLKGLRPLAGISRTRTVLCGEMGPYREYKSDRFGFNNPDSVWDSPAAIALIGDSFVHGNCVPADSTIAAVLRARGIRAVSLGISGDGPVSSLAILREYAGLTHPKMIGWFFYEGNDLCDLDDEVQDTLLTAYLVPTFRQSLWMRQADIDRLLRADQNAQVDRLRSRYGSRSWDLRSMLVLGQVRQLAGASTLSGGNKSGRCDDLATLKRVLRRAQQDVADMGAKLTFIYLPGNRPTRKGMTLDQIHDAVLGIVASLGVPVTDLSPVLRQADVAPRVWSFPGSHYTADGYRLVANEIAAQLFPKRPETAQSIAK